MAKPIKETPVLKGAEATRFMREVKANGERDHSASFARAQAVFEQFASRLPSPEHVSTHAR